jgi:hypothetical protein
MARDQSWMDVFGPPKEKGPMSKIGPEAKIKDHFTGNRNGTQSVDGHHLTVLEVQPGHTACKTISHDAQKLADYNLGTWFNFHRYEFSDWGTLTPLLDMLASDNQQLLVMGEPISWPMKGAHRRLLFDRTDAKATLRKGRAILMPFDLDGAQVPGMDLLDPVADPQECVRAALGLMPEAFQRASVWYTFTSSQTLAPVEGLRLRLVFMLNTPWHLLDMARFANRLNRDVPELRVDSGIYSGNQPIYLSRPVVKGGPDPIPNRSGFIQGVVDTVDIPMTESAAFSPWSAGNGGGGVFLPHGRDPLDLIGDQDGGLGCYQGLRAATWHLVRMQGDTLSDGDIKRIVRERVAVSVWNEQHPPEYVRAQITDSKLESLVKGAREKLGARQKLFYDIAPDYPSRPMDREQAVMKLDQAIDMAAFEASLGVTGKITLIQGAAGLGKTTRTLAEAIDAKLTVRMFVSSFKLADELVQKVTSMGATVEVMRGRTRDDGDILPRKMCDKSELAQALTKMGVTNLQNLMCIRSQRGGTVTKCPSFGHCGYAMQFKSQAQVQIYTHAHLALEPGIFERDAPEADITVVDEDFVKALIQEKTWPLADARAAGGVVAQIADIAASRLPLVHELRVRYDDPVGAVQEALEEMGQSSLPVWPSLQEEVALKKIKGIAAPLSFAPLLEGVLEALRSSEDRYNGVWLGVDGEKKEWLHLARLKAPVRLMRGAGKVLLLDATPNVDALAKALGELPLEVHEINCQRQAFVVQVYDSSVSKSRLSSNAELRKDLIGLVDSCARRYGSVGVCGPKDMIADVQSKLAEHLAQGSVVPAHFGNLRGQDALKGTSVGIVIGRQLPRAFDVERMARAIWPHDDLHLPGQYTIRPAGYRMRDSSLKGVMDYGHPDPRVATVLQQICDSESSQALDRHRLIHREVPKLVLVLSKRPLDVEVDSLVELDKVLGHRGLAGALMEHTGVLPLGADWLAKNVSGIGGRKSAEHWAARVVKSLALEIPPNLYKGEIEGRPPLPSALLAKNNPHFSIRDLGGKSYPQPDPQFSIKGNGQSYPQPDPRFSYIYLGKAGVIQPHRLLEYRLAGKSRGHLRKAVASLPGLDGVRSVLARHHDVAEGEVTDLRWVGAEGDGPVTMLTSELPMAPIATRLLLPGIGLICARPRAQSLLCSAVGPAATGELGMARRDL